MRLAWCVVLLAACDPSPRRGAKRPPTAAPVLPALRPDPSRVLLSRSGAFLFPLACWDGARHRFAAGAACLPVLPAGAEVTGGRKLAAPTRTCSDQRTGFPLEDGAADGFVTWPASEVVSGRDVVITGPEPVDKIHAMPNWRPVDIEDAESALIEPALSRTAGRAPAELWFQYDVYTMDLDGDGHDERVIEAEAHPRPSGDYLYAGVYLVSGGKLVEVEASPEHRVLGGMFGADLDGDGHLELVLPIQTLARDDPDDGAHLVVHLGAHGPELIAHQSPCNRANP